MAEFYERASNQLVAHDGHALLSSTTLANQIASLSDQLKIRFPDKTSAINICVGRVHFLRSFFAIIDAGMFNLLPPNKQQATLLELSEQYPDCILIHDGLDVGEFLNPCLDVRELNLNDDDEGQLRSVDKNQLAALSFTSGSSGESQAIRKTWSVLMEGALINARNMLIGADENLNILATVPPHHMYGLEITVLLPMLSKVCSYTGQPLLPSDVLRELNAMPAPRALVSTPQHLKALVESGLEFPAVSRLYSATAPLQQGLAQKVEALFDGELVEIYGCSEIGSIARRRTANEDAWTPFDAMNFELGVDGKPSFVSAHHVSDKVELQDLLRPAEGKGFTLHGRVGDMINIAGIRGSLSQINQRLLAIDGVDDGVVFMPDTAEPNDDTVQRLAAIVVSKTHNRRSLSTELKKHVPPAFVPRPMLFTNALPRNETSKLPRADVLKLFEQLMASQQS